MKRLWIGIALLAASWLPGVGYYHLPDWLIWAIFVVAGVLLLTDAVPRLPAGWWAVAGGIILVPALFVAPWPLKAIPILLIVGMIVHATPIPRRWPAVLGRGAVAAGLVLLAQALVLVGYEIVTGRSHELPGPLPGLLALVARLLGMEAAASGSTLALSSMRKTHDLGATWELLVDPVTLCFLAGGVALLALVAWSYLPRGRRASYFTRATAILVLSIAVWLPVRAGLMAAIYLHGVLRTEYEAPLNVMGQFWSTPLLLGLLAVPVLLAWAFLRRPATPATLLAGMAQPAPAAWHVPVAAALAALAVFVLTAAAIWDPVGTRAQGRVIVDEFHSNWERTDKPYDTKWYGHTSGYNYACIYDYLSRFYKMSRLTTALTDDALKDCDVLILKVPTERYTAEEIPVVRRFVENGGSLMLVGEHTDVFGTGTHLNQMARQFGFEFRYDCVFGIDTGFEQRYVPSIVPHPIVQGMPDLDWAVSCSIHPMSWSGRAPLRAVGVKNLPADFHVSNFYPQLENRPDMRYGAFVQLWSTRAGKGRVVAFTDSTQPSNFSAFEPGKAELVVGMTEWLNHKGASGSFRFWLALAGIALLIGAVVVAEGWGGSWLVLVAAGILGWSLGILSISAYNHAKMPMPKNAEPLVRVLVDRNLCSVPLSKSGFIGGKADGFGIFERWILRLGYFTKRVKGDEPFDGDALVFTYPSEPVTREYRDRVVDYVNSGGSVLVVDSGDNGKSTANTLLYPFGISLKRPGKEAGVLAVPEGWPVVGVNNACEVTGGKPFLKINNKPVATRAEMGRGVIWVVACGTRFTDVSMGVTGDVVPDANMQKVYDLEFALMRAIVGRQDVGLLPEATPKAPAKTPSN